MPTAARYYVVLSFPAGLTSHPHATLDEAITAARNDLLAHGVDGDWAECVSREDWAVVRRYTLADGIVKRIDR